MKRFLTEGMVQSCYAVDGGCALHIENEEEYKAVVFSKDKNAYLVDLEKDAVLEKPYPRIEIF